MIDNLPYEDRLTPNENALFRNLHMFQGFYPNPIFLHPESQRNLDQYGYPSSVLVDVNNHYKTNQLGYRSKEFSQTDIIFSGCSFTFGIGTDINANWSSVVGKYIGLDYVNLGRNGASTMENILGIFSYCKKYGNPKYIFCLFPNFERIVLQATHGFSGSKLFLELDDPLIPTYAPVQLHFDYDRLAGHKDRPKFLKMPYAFEDIISLDIAYWLNIRLIEILEQYCNSNNIKLLWSTWDEHGTELLENVIHVDKSIFNNYVKSDVLNWRLNDSVDGEVYIENNIIKECHEHLKHDYPNSFYSATDIEYGKDKRHPGVHKQMHYAETFINKIKELNL
jgi:hypothetical protein